MRFKAVLSLMERQSIVPSGLLRYTARAFEAVEIESRKCGIEMAMVSRSVSICDPFTNRSIHFETCGSDEYESDFEPLHFLQAATRLSSESSLCFENGRKWSTSVSLPSGELQ